MKYALLLGISLLLSVTSWSQTPTEPNKNTKLLVYYFHITNRCQTCTKIEATTKKILDEQYAKQLENGTIIFKSFNVDIPENAEMVKKYQAYGATLAFTYIVTGKEAGNEDLTGMAFQKIGNEEMFTKELKAKIDEAIK
jgi:hypothetical protein